MANLPLDDTDRSLSGRDRQDAALLDRVRAGDSAAYAQLLHAWWQPIVRYAARLVGSVDGAEDIAQEAFVRLWERRNSWRPTSTPRLILYTIVRNLAISQRRNRAARAGHLATHPLSLIRHPVTPAQAVEGEEFRVALTRAIDALSPRRREVLLLSRDDGLSRAEIAALTGLSPQTVANYLAIAIAELREVLRPFLNEREGS